MSVAEILSELPKLTPEQRSTVSRRLRELEEQDSVLFLHEAADLMFLETETQEKDNGSRKGR